MRLFKTLLVPTIVLTCLTGLAKAEFISPDRSTSPFEGWTAGATDSTSYAWDVFSGAGAGPHEPDVSSFGPSGASLTETTGTGFLTGTGNIYSFSAPTEFDVTLPNYDMGAGYNTRVVAQIATVGSPLDESTVRLTYDGGAGDITADYDYFEAAEGEWLFAWDLQQVNPASVLLQFGAAASSMSLDRITVDTFAQTGAFAALPQTVPEPSSVALLALAACGLAAVAMRRRFDRAALGG